MKKIGLTLAGCWLLGSAVAAQSSGGLQDLKWATSPGQAQLSWTNPQPDQLAAIEVWSVVKKIGQGRKPYQLTTTLPGTAVSCNLAFSPLSEVYVQVKAKRRDGSMAPPLEIKGIVAHQSVVVRELDGRRLYVYLPPGYQAGQTYPVAYLQDGQNLFSPGSGAPDEWLVDETLDQLIQSKLLPPLLVVGVASYTTRTEDYWPRALGYQDGQGETYAAWLVDRLLPYAEREFGASQRREDRAVMGSSFGAAISLYLGTHYGSVFGFAAPLSPAMDYGGLDYLKTQTANGTRFYFDCGEKEFYTILHSTAFDFPAYTRAMLKQLVADGWVLGQNLFYDEVPGATSHKEAEVAKRLRNPFLLFKGLPVGPGQLQVSLSYSHPGPDTTAWINPRLIVPGGLALTQLTGVAYQVTAGPGRIAPDGTVDWQGGTGLTATITVGGQSQTLTCKKPD